MIRFKTVSGSTYDADTDAMKIRRKDATHAVRGVPDGHWLPYEKLVIPGVGKRALVEFDDYCIFTSLVTEVQEL